jgi:hypothetical protein
LKTIVIFFPTAPGSYTQSIFTILSFLVRLLANNVAGSSVSSNCVPSALLVLGGSDTDLGGLVPDSLSWYCVSSE